MFLKVFLLQNLICYRVNKLLHFTAFPVLVYFCMSFFFFFLMLCLMSYVSYNFTFSAMNEREETLESM